MSERKYSDFSVSRRVNISSTGHYSFIVGFKGWSRRGLLRFDGFKYFWTETTFPTFPAYVVTALQRLVLDRLRAEDTIYYENDRYGGQRTTELRYHNLESVAWMIKCLEEKLAEAAPDQTSFLK